MNAKYIDVLLEEIRQFQANTKKKYAEVKEVSMNDKAKRD